MGTRNVTKAISDGKVRLCQYGQWDGHPTCTGVKILEWIKKGDFDAIKECKFTVLDQDGLTATGYPYDDKIAEMSKEYANKIHSKMREHPYTYLLDTDKEMLEEFGEDLFVKFKLASRDTGADILYLITKPVNTYSDPYVAGLNGTDYQIEAFNLIDFDNEIVHMKWHDKEDAWSFKGIQKLDIEKTMERFEEK